MISSHNNFGYYKVGESVFNSKNLAFSESLLKGVRPQFIYNDDIFSVYDWTKEPEPNVELREFYRRRAQQLRDEYDYVILQYSGGPDSKNILDTFLLNDIKLDEIVNFNSYNSTNVYEGTTHNADFLYNVKPFIENNIDNKNFPKITIIDEVETTKRIWKDYKSKDYFELLFSAGTFPSFWIMTGIWVKYVEHIWNMILSGKKVCVVLGVDKPNIKIDKEKYFVTFNDIMSCDIAFSAENDDILSKSNIIEFFYHTPKFPELIIKQAHVLKKVVESYESLNLINNFYSIDDFNDTQFRNPFFCLSKKFVNKNLNYNLYHSAIYPTFNQNIVTPKPKKYGTRLIDCWWVNHLEDDYRKMWMSGSAKYVKSFYPLIRETASVYTVNHIKFIDFSPLPLLFSKKYYLE